MVGSSITKYAFIKARTRPGGINLGLQRMQAEIWWQGRSGLTLNKVRSQINIMRRFENAPHFILLQIGGNDIGKVRLGLLQLQLKQFLAWLCQQLPQTKIIFSQILPRSEWRYSGDKPAMDRCRRRLNSTMATYLIKRGGYYVHYPDIKCNNDFFQKDGVHLTDLGNDVYLNIIQGAIETFITQGVVHSFP